ncbi:histidinol-phosphate transaminase [uncultured Clostridium sp.]|uniref:pyridoxal phosphate-dependent aminotransferase n=1 Tax=uncultured Clostridium sp. TaxID=59620 RepID=UPI00260A6622|nr:histidinol-phosphate transaminase [uncultured Clostridium sp.]
MSEKHGANLFDLEMTLGLKKEDILDFSSNINPFGASQKAKEMVKERIDDVSIYPDPDYHILRESISEYADCNKDNIVLGGGATELIVSFIDTINPKKALILYPSYSEYEKDLKKIDCKIEKYFAKKENDFKVSVEGFKEKIKEGKYDLVIICNPNNPTGFCFKRSEIEEIISDAKDTFFMVDETYIEFTDKEIFSSTSLVDNYNNLYVIRGTSKFFSTPGIRLGYGLIGNEEVRESIKTSLPLWNINILATIMGEVMFKDKEFIDRTLVHVKKEIENLTQSLKTIDYINVYETKGNFILCEISSGKEASVLYDSLSREGMIIRDCSSFEGLDKNFFRVCILKTKDNEKLINKMKQVSL